LCEEREGSVLGEELAVVGMKSELKITWTQEELHMNMNHLSFNTLSQDVNIAEKLIPTEDIRPISYSGMELDGLLLLKQRGILAVKTEQKWYWSKKRTLNLILDLFSSEINQYEKGLRLVILNGQLNTDFPQPQETKYQMDGCRDQEQRMDTKEDS
jgi:hypothetical protein